MPIIPRKHSMVCSSSSHGLKIVADENILLAREAFSTLGTVTTLKGNQIGREAVADADVLVTRTTTKVTRQLLENSTIRYVATATAGTDHIDLEYLKTAGIGFASAPGCNATAVAEFVINGLVRLSQEKSLDLAGRTLGIIGAGNTGSALQKKAACLGLNCLLNDPPLFEKTGNSDYIPLSELVNRSDILSLHVPLTRTGRYPTYHLFDNAILERINPHAILINTSRGGVINESNLTHHRHKFSGVILDVWEQEPKLDKQSLCLADIATPHIAGYSLDGKIKATEMAYNQICRYFGLAPCWNPSLRQNSLQLDVADKHPADFLNSLLSNVYDIYDDDKRLRRIINQADPEQYFQSLRSNYTFRREFSSFRVTMPSAISTSTRELIRCLGFKLY